LLAVAVCWVLALARPAPVATEDPGLAPELARLAGRRSRRVAAVVVDLDAAAPVRSAFIRADAGTRFETGSVTKALTGMLLADAIERGELSMDSTVGELFPETRQAVAVLASVSRPADQQRIALGLARSLAMRRTR
jgi:CubicO group peptidase (beta-lactamase class C family)